MDKNEKVEKIKEIVNSYSFFLQNCHGGFIPTEKGDYVYFLKSGLKGIEGKIPQDFLNQEKFEENTRFVKVGGEEKLKVKSKLIKLTESLLVNEEEISKKLALFLDKKVIDLLQRKASLAPKEISQYLPTNLEVRKYYKLMFLLKNSVGFFNHDPRCVHQTFISARNLVFLLNPRIRPKKLLEKLSIKNESWFLRETFLRHIIGGGGSNETGSRDIAIWKLIPKNIAFLFYEYDALWLWFDIKTIKEEEKNVSVTIKYCAKVAKRCVFFYPLESKNNKN